METIQTILNLTLTLTLLKKCYLFCANLHLVVNSVHTSAVLIRNTGLAQYYDLCPNLLLCFFEQNIFLVSETFFLGFYKNNLLRHEVSAHWFYY